MTSQPRDKTRDNKKRPRHTSEFEIDLYRDERYETDVCFV